jgi:hypothetical protein
MICHEIFSNTITAEAYTSWLARPYDLMQENDIQKIRDIVNARFDLFKSEVATMVSNSLQERPEFNELNQILRDSIKLIREGSTWAEVKRISLTKTGIEGV